MRRTVLALVGLLLAWATPGRGQALFSKAPAAPSGRVKRPEASSPRGAIGASDGPFSIVP